MKIFNWVHRKFNYKNVDNYVLCPKKGELPFHDSIKLETVTIENDNEALLEEVTLADVFYGILTIGTFGLDPLNGKEYSVNDNHKETEESSEKETVDEYTVKYNDTNNLNPLVVKTVKRNLGEVVNDYDLDTCTTNIDRLISTVDDAFPLLKSDNTEIVEKKRVTLADLFSADSEDVVAEKLNSGKTTQDSGEKKHVLFTKNKDHLSTKKLMTHKGEDFRPMKKLQGFVSKMVRKKIHPELESKNPRKDGSFNNGRRPEMISLLQDVVFPL